MTKTYAVGSRRGLGRPPGAGRPRGGINKKSAIFGELLKKCDFNSITEFVDLIQKAKETAPESDNPSAAYVAIANVVARMFPYQYPQLAAVDWNIIHPQGQEVPKITINMSSQKLVQVFTNDKEEIFERDPAIINTPERTAIPANLGGGSGTPATPTDHRRPLLPPKRKP